MDTADDGLLVRRAQEGDRAAFAGLVRRHHRLVVALCRRMVGADEAEDAAQEALLLAMLQLDRLRQPERFGAWLAGIALNVCRLWLRARSRGAEAWLGSELVDGQPGPADRAAAAELSRRVRAAVDLLPPGQRAAVRLHYLTGLSQAEVAAALGLEPGAVRVRLHKARRSLRAPLRPLWSAETEKEDLVVTAEASADLIEVRVKGVRLNPRSGNPAVDLVEKAGEKTGGGRLFLLRLAAADAEALGARLEGRSTPRPLTHDFAASLVDAAGTRVSRVVLERLADEVLYATVALDGPAGAATIDARPSDAVNLAVRAGAPVFVRAELFGRFGTTPEELARQEAEADAAARLASGPLSPGAVRVLGLLQEDVPRRFRHAYIGTEHLLLALAEDADGPAGRALAGAGATPEAVADDLAAIVGRGPEPYAGDLAYTPRMRRLLKLTGDELRELGHTTVGTGHLLLGLLREGEGLAIGILEDLGVDTEALREAVLRELADGDA